LNYFSGSAALASKNEENGRSIFCQQKGKGSFCAFSSPPKNPSFIIMKKEETFVVF